MSLSQYPRFKISQLKPGPVQACFSGLVLNLQYHVPESPTLTGAKACVKLILRDETDEILVNVWYLDARYKMTLGNIVTIWATHVCSSSKRGQAPPQPGSSRDLSASISTSLFPERNVGCGLRIFRNEPGCPSLIRHDMLRNVVTQAELGAVTSLESLMASNSNRQYQHNVSIVVYVVGIGKCVSGSTTSTDTSHKFPAIAVMVVDQSNPHAPVKVIFENPIHESVAPLKPRHTILLVTNPRVVGGQMLATSYSSRIFLDPEISVAGELRRFLRQMAPPCNMTMQENADLEEEYGLDDRVSRPQHLTTLQEFRSTILRDPGTPYQVVVRVTITSICLASLFKQERLFCMTCPSCSRDRYCNQAVDWCDCDVDARSIDMRLNPHVLGGFSDETAGFLQYSPGWGDEGSATRDGRTPQKQHLVPRDAGTFPIFLTDRALSSLLGVRPLEIETLAILETEQECLATFDAVEKDLIESPVILLLGWTGSDLAQPSEVHRLDSSTPEDQHDLRNGRLTILDAAADIAIMVPDQRT
ncbi:hypothetical protein H2204_012025 [Knufia peltigerae]|uniref:Uncharacterized protein n=1 Tax=Knufia peltigerae TaxID=1002370 RepID=A0AA38XTI8_9EURO|nr:hypothetical protein H2204_012025 [Knufia peltigerae]